ncbi:hypothetical protein [Nitrosomonas oligotropha]|uniref:hypothetical protein n=1 Tax=Nitrosomonas oligotropha TaxID=42354 RepID=UPI00136F1F95|nr:hypothetical protein [Nitrosomonas oligotropha]MXS83653.1 hypothetical protein [Nitrosomonas oligotropha]
MSGYLARLKKTESKENLSNTPITEVPKVSEVPFDTFDTPIQAGKQKNILLIQSWLFKIGEPEEDHGIVLNKCRNDPDAMEYFLNHARGEYIRTEVKIL